MKFRDYLLLALSGSILISSCQSISPEAKLNNDESLDKLCGEIHNIKELSQMQELIDSVKLAMSEMSYLDYQKLISSGGNRYFKLALHPSRQCLEQAAAIMDLAPIIAERENVCQAGHINKLAAYKSKHLTSNGKNDKVKYREDVNPITEEFFSIYLNQVAYTCKQNLLAALTEADKRVGGFENYAKVLPWIKNSEGCTLDDAVLDAAGDDYDVFGLSGYGKSSKSARDRRCEAIRALSSIKKVKELVEALEDNEKQQQQVGKLEVANGSISATKTPQANEAKREQSQSDGSGLTETEESAKKKDEFILVVPEHKYSAIEDMMRTCSMFEQVYTHTVMPIVQLNLMNVDPSLQNFNKAFDHQCLNEELIQRWFSITLICKPLLNSRLTSKSDATGQANQTNGLIVVKSKNYLTKPIELGKGEPPSYLSYPIEDDLWIGKHKPSSLAKMKSKFITRVVKTFRINKLVNSIVWRKSFKEDRKVSISLILVVLTLIGLDGSFFFHT